MEDARGAGQGGRQRVLVKVTGARCHVRVAAAHLHSRVCPVTPARCHGLGRFGLSRTLSHAPSQLLRTLLSGHCPSEFCTFAFSERHVPGTVL